jgi:hypothetical protein
VAIEVCLFFNFVVVFSLIGDSTVIGMIIGEAQRTVRSASSFLLFIFWPIGEPLIMDQGTLVRHFFWRRGHRFANTIRAGGFGSPILLAQGASDRQFY